jgi:large subunit ribosomal protein L21
MYAIIADGGKQYKVSPGDVLDIEKKPLTAGSKVEFAEVLLVADNDDIKIGAPNLEKCKVTATVVDQVKGPKLTVMKFRRRKGSKTKTGHRQKYTRVKIEEILKK